MKNLWLKTILKKSARSFYLSLAIVPSEVQELLGYGFLFCKIADTIADSETLITEIKIRALEAIREALSKFPLERKNFVPSLSLIESIVDESTDPDKPLLLSYEKTIDLLFTFNKTDQSLLANVVNSVTEGMLTDLKFFGVDANSIKAFETDSQLMTYTNQVAGEPGRFWTKVCLEHLPSIELRDRARFIHEGIQFGQGLQLINILRDFPKDLTQGRCYFPKERLSKVGLKPEDLFDKEKNPNFLTIYHELIEDTLPYLESGLNYITKLPRRALFLRAAIWWPLVIGLKTLGKLREENEILGNQKKVKISRKEVFKTIFYSALILPFNSLLKREYLKLAYNAKAAL